jgi:hypothetical protein
LEIRYERFFGLLVGVLGGADFAIFFSRSSNAASSSLQPRSRGACSKFADCFLSSDSFGLGFMIFTAQDIGRLRGGSRGPITVGEIRQDVAKAMGLIVPLVYLSKESLAHINLRHPDISDFDLTAAPFVLKHGLILRENRKPNTYLAAHVGLYCPKRTALCIKVARPDREAYMVSFYRLHHRQTRTWLDRCEIVKTHD